MVLSLDTFCVSTRQESQIKVRQNLMGRSPGDSWSRRIRYRVYLPWIMQLMVPLEAWRAQ